MLSERSREMTITYLEFFYVVLFAARCMDECWPEFEAEKIIWQSYSFGNDGAHYLPQEKRRAPNGWKINL